MNFVNTIAHWSKPVRQFLRNLQTRRAFIAAFTSEKRLKTIKMPNDQLPYEMARNLQRALTEWGTGGFF
jgi:hypothetical protein